ncbi:MAG: DEAD/DEAH box helicase [Microthrixaceae bacterium]
MTLLEGAAAARGGTQGSLFERIEPRTDLVEGVSFHPAVAAWFERRFPEGASAPQAAGWPHLAQGRSTLVAAPTGSGKTLAGFLMCINDLYLRHAAGEPVSGARVVYVSPLKALAVDIAENLQRPLEEIAEVAAEAGLDAPALTVGVRTGDTTPAERASMVRNPPTFVVTTPESLYLLVTAQRSRAVLAGIETLIVDEIHALARDKRGAHLALTLERLDHVCERPPVRVGLSATQKPIEVIAALLVGTRSRSGGEPDVEIVDAGHQRDMDLALELPAGELEAVISAAQMDSVLDRIAELVESRRTTLVFVNTRKLAERLAHQLGERLGEDVVAAHHGSLSRERRHRVESRLRAGDLRALVATASLELGIDVGPVELVCQIGSPRSIATFLQRVGRSNHTRVGTPTGRLFPLTRDELVESTALMAAVRAGRLDSVEPPVAPLDILAQQVVAETAAEQWRTDDLYELVCRAHHYRDLGRGDFDEVIDLVSKGVLTGRGPRAAHVHHDAVNGELRGRRGARLAALTSGGAIPELGDYRVVLEPDETFIGTVNEDWATESMAGDIFLLGTHSWQIRQVTAGQVRVVDAGDKPPTIPFWLGEAPARTVELSAEVSRLRHEVDSRLAAADPLSAVQWVRDAAGWARTRQETVVDASPREGRCSDACPPRATSCSSGSSTRPVECSSSCTPRGGPHQPFDGLRAAQEVLPPSGELQASANGDTVVISLGPHHSFPLSDVPRFLSEASIRPTLTRAVLDQPIFLSALALEPEPGTDRAAIQGGRRNHPDPAHGGRRPDGSAVPQGRGLPGEHHRADRGPRPRSSPRRCTTPSPRPRRGGPGRALAPHRHGRGRGPLPRHDRAGAGPRDPVREALRRFLDDGEAVDRHCAVPLGHWSAGRSEELGRLQPEAIEQVRAEVDPRPTTPDELHDLLSALVLTRARPSGTSCSRPSRRATGCAASPPGSTPRSDGTPPSGAPGSPR